MNKEEFLRELQTKIASGEVSRAEIAEMAGLSQRSTSPAVSAYEVEEPRHSAVTKMLYVLGAGIVTIGIIIFIAQIWDDMGAFGRILITFGLGVLMALLGSMLLRTKPESNLGTIFHFIGGMLIPAGAIITLDEINLDTDWSLALTFLGLFVFYLILSSIHKNAILTFFTITNGTAAAYLVANALFDPILGYKDMETLFQYLTMVLGASYILLARSFEVGWNGKLVDILSFFGATGLLGAAFFRVFDSGVWELFYFVLVFFMLFMSVYMKSRIILLMSTLFLIAHVTYITSEYFADSLGWPVALVLLGFVFIGLGYGSLAINNRYIKRPL